MNGTTKAPRRDAQLMIVTDKNPNPHAEKKNYIIKVGILKPTVEDETIHMGPRGS